MLSLAIASSEMPSRCLTSGAQRVAVRGDQHRPAGQQVRHDRVVPVRQRAHEHVLEALGARHQLGRQRRVARVAGLRPLVVRRSIGGGGTSYDRRQSMNCSSPYSSSVCFLFLPCSAP